MSKRKRRGTRRANRINNQPSGKNKSLKDNITPSPSIAAGTDSGAFTSGPESVAENEQAEADTTKQSDKRERPKGSRSKSNLPPWRREQLRAAGRARGEQLKRDKEHQRKAGLARSAKGDMSETGKKGNARAVEKDPEHQSRSRRGKKKSKPGDNDKIIKKGQGTQSHQTNEATGEEKKQ